LIKGISPNEFLAISNTLKETKKVKKGIEKFISMMSSNPSLADQ
jgi:hypothetical protein